MYRVDNRHKQRRRRSLFWLMFTLFFIIIAIVAALLFIKATHKKPVITQAKAVITKLSYAGKTKHYNEGDFGIDIPAEWVAVPRPPYTYQSFAWHNVDKNNGMTIEIYEDTIPTNFAVNRALVITGETDHIELVGPASENCIDFSNDAPHQANSGVVAKWQNVDFLCNRSTTTRDVIGTSSKDGINTVKLKGSNGSPHSFFFTYSDNQISPDYTAFYNALSSFSMN